MKPYVFEDHPHELRLHGYCGLTGFGKSSLMEHNLAETVRMLDGQPINRIIVVDPKQDDYHFARFGRLVTDPEQMQKIIRESPRQFLIRFVTDDVRHFSYICITAAKLGQVHLFIDEVRRFAPWTKANTKMTPIEFDDIVCDGRHEGVRIHTAFQRPTQVHNNLVKNIHEKIIFCTEDAQIFRGVLQTRENLAKVQTLEKGLFFCCKPGRAPELCQLPPKNG